MNYFVSVFCSETIPDINRDGSGFGSHSEKMNCSVFPDNSFVYLCTTCLVIISSSGEERNILTLSAVCLPQYIKYKAKSKLNKKYKLI